MPQAKRKVKQAGTCCVPECGDVAVARGLCAACYSWDVYHRNASHGLNYMVEAGYRYERLASRAAAFAKPATRRRGLRIVKGGKR